MISSEQTKISWTALKALANSKAVNLQYLEFDSNYTVYVLDGTFSAYTRILKTSPANSDQTDFETNYKAGANQTIDTGKLVGGTDGTLIGNTGDRLRVDAQFTSPPSVSEQTFKTFQITLNSIATANNKSMISIQNASGSSVKVKIREIRVTNVQNTAVTGTTVDLRLFRATSHSGGTSTTPLLYDTSDTLSSSITARTGATITGEAANMFYCWKWSTDEWAQGAQDVESMDHTMQTLLPVYSTPMKTRPLTLNANEAMTIKCLTNTATGLFCIQIIFTEETT